MSLHDVAYNPDSKNVAVQNLNKTECDNLLILFDLYSSESTTKTKYVMFYLINIIDL